MPQLRPLEITPETQGPGGAGYALPRRLGGIDRCHVATEADAAEFLRRLVERVGGLAAARADPA